MKCPTCGTLVLYKSRIVSSEGRIIVPDEAWCPKCKKDVLAKPCESCVIGKECKEMSE